MKLIVGGFDDQLYDGAEEFSFLQSRTVIMPIICSMDAQFVLNPFTPGWAI